MIARLSKLILVVLMTLIMSACANYLKQRQAEQCLPGSHCFRQLSPSSQAIKRQQWLQQRQNNDRMALQSHAQGLASLNRDNGSRL